MPRRRSGSAVVFAVAASFPSLAAKALRLASSFAERDTSALAIAPFSAATRSGAIHRRNWKRFGFAARKALRMARLASALKWGLADCESLSVQADKQTLTPEGFAKVTELLKFRPMQLALVLKILLGVEEMRRKMVQAIGVAKRLE